MLDNKTPLGNGCLVVSDVVISESEVDLINLFMTESIIKKIENVCLTYKKGVLRCGNDVVVDLNFFK